MSRKRSVLHSQERHRSRNYKRRVRNLFLEITFIIILAIVAIKFVKKDEDKPKVSGIGNHEQQQIIDQQMGETINIPKKEVSKELMVPELNMEGISIVKAIMKYEKEKNQTIINIDVKNYGELLQEARQLIALVDDKNTILTTYIEIPTLNTKQQTRINLVLDGNYEKTTKLELRDEE